MSDIWVFCKSIKKGNFTGFGFAPTVDVVANMKRQDREKKLSESKLVLVQPEVTSKKDLKATA